jgi:hypothetical protein
MLAGGGMNFVVAVLGFLEKGALNSDLFSKVLKIIKGSFK